MNRSCLVGRLTRDPELRNTASGTAVANFAIAVDRRFKSEGQPEADFINIVVWGKTAEFTTKYFSKGMRVFVDGRIQTRSWEDNDGNKRNATEVVAESVGFADGKKDDNKNSNNSNQNNDDYISDDDVPF